ncbi:MAG: hypothetical protein HeimC3_13880 [Candidatus Heimdallarchaeota archaeon LC_3]|nr:MAG: hypothetical protein HeimC3_13880 [Candidatus Heimdallarchaeota archaeon LC_3]
MKLHLQALEINKKVEDKFDLSQTYSNVGQNYRALGNNTEALKNYEMGLQIGNELFNQARSSSNISGMWSLYSILYPLISLYLENNNIIQAKNYLQQLEEIDKYLQTQGRGDVVLSLNIRMAKAKIMKFSPRLTEKAAAQQIFQEIIAGKTIFHNYTLEAMFHLCDLYLDELRLSGEKIILKEVKNLLNQVYEIGQTQSRFPVIIESLILQAKLSLLEGEIDRANGLLVQALLLTEEKGLNFLQKKVESEQKNLEQQLEKWKTLYEKNTPIYELIQKTKIDSYLKEARKLI